MAPQLWLEATIDASVPDIMVLCLSLVSQKRILGDRT